MSKAFATVAESDSLNLGVLWRSRDSFSIIRIVLALPHEDVKALCLKHGAAAFQESAAARKALALLSSSLEGREDSELESMFSMDGVNAFSIKLLKALRAKVPRGRVISYGALAELCGNPGAARAAGMAMASNPFPLFYPCHRVVGAGGALTGFGFGLEMKRQLLTLEGVEFKDAKTIARSSFI